MAVKNAPPYTVAVSQLESRVPVKAHQDATVGHVGASTFESRVVQETGTH